MQERENGPWRDMFTNLIPVTRKLKELEVCIDDTDAYRLCRQVDSDCIPGHDSKEEHPNGEDWESLGKPDRKEMLECHANVS